MKLYIHTSSTTESTARAERTDVVFRISMYNNTPVSGCNVYTVYVDNKRDMHEITRALHSLLGESASFSYCSHVLPLTKG